MLEVSPHVVIQIYIPLSSILCPPHSITFPLPLFSFAAPGVELSACLPTEFTRAAILPLKARLALSVTITECSMKPMDRISNFTFLQLFEGWVVHYLQWNHSLQNEINDELVQLDLTLDLVA